MKYIHHYDQMIEDEPTKPKVGDYAVLKNKFNRPPIVANYVTTHICQILSQRTSNSYDVTFDNAPKLHPSYDYNLKNGWHVGEDEMLFFSPNKLEAEKFILNIKYNI